MTTSPVCSFSALLAAAVVTFGLSAAVYAADAPAHDHNHSATANQPAPIDTRPTDAMRNMQAMHEKWMAARTPAERQALMAAHMQSMQEAMKSMQHMEHGGSHGDTSHDSMQQHMDMMTMMMQMMLDREQMYGNMAPGTPGTAPDHSQPAAPQVDPTKP